ncbi:MAG: hypothetical protein A3C43_03225 [Candidatus Schekmanbacteria bacterium RIFCSPHIGHO2_02_FULL_38_11]|uniref:Ribosomal RNA large subunit methyltransferase E n=1 Tax=Candidatus Schekmanbacteria bacterium RIFCSPLOWO2_12_FULL_38_15 TaxID=1817883 RepID=A0A1F7SN58_9BACT|nr:MAG: hypothetical protein A2043_02990 [Candidatus Schekmanbacteria bacterium GWA2_38_9]OGL54291.1 MAG: hypothetical protein A3C43_03225 [Candidatus Schekmanbacteria bacterium RIFCSPHIGHO2_02_FULL_38_11]OGL55215.1 MAG: hypothetical protein A3G31_09600 [Candidatus Schekmanbacteria bacterium RIFCSPLOWO2_12_FULL_38_15]
MYNPRDSYWRRAKKEGYRSRASYKLIELNEKFKLLKRGDRVLDVGCAPGGWMQVALEIVGEKGFVYGVDIEKVESFHKSNAEIIIADISKAKGRELILNKADGMLDAIISDIAPHTTGVKIADQAKSLELSKEAFRISKILLKESGNFLVKIFQGSDIKKFLEELKLNFREVKITKPEATRKGSAEVYIVGKGFMGNSKCIVNSE